MRFGSLTCWGKRIRFALSAVNKLLFMKEDPVWDFCFGEMRSFCFILVPCYLPALTAAFLLLKVTFKGVAQLRNSKAKFQCLRCNLYKLFSATLFLVRYIKLGLFITSSCSFHFAFIARHKSPRFRLTSIVLITCHKNSHFPQELLTYLYRKYKSLWISEIWRCLTKPLVQPPTLSISLGYLFKDNSLSAGMHKHSTCRRSYFQLKIKKTPQNKYTLYSHDFLHLSLNQSLCSEIGSYFKHKNPLQGQVQPASVNQNLPICVVFQENH